MPGESLLAAVRAHRRLADGILAVGLAIVVTLEAVSADVTVPDTLGVPVVLAMTLPLALRRRLPLLVVVVVFGAFGMLGALDESEQPPQLVLLPAAVAAWSAGAFASQRAARLGLVAILAGLATNEAGDLIVLAPLMTGVWAVGGALRDRERWGMALEARAVALEQERAENAQRAIAQERARIARELHDVIAHHVSVIVMQAGAERLAVGAARPQTTETLQTIEDTGRRALAEMRRLLGVLRRDDEAIALAPQPSLRHLESLAEHMRGAGLPVDLVIDGSVVDVPPGVDISGYRVVQEALTNALRHAGPARARVHVRYGSDCIDIEITDDGHGAASGPSEAGHGLVGMQERVTIYGGALEVGPKAGGGFAVRTRLPIPEARR